MFPGDPPFLCTPLLRMDRGDPFGLSRISLGTHTGTHVDAPAHCLLDGPPLEGFPLEAFVGPGVVLDLRGGPHIDRRALEDALEQAPRGLHERVLLKTDNGPRAFSMEMFEDYVALTEEAAQCLLTHGVRLVGIDGPSIEAPGEMRVHRLLLGAGVPVVEWAHLAHVPGGVYEVLCLPLPVRGADGSPVRLLLRAP